MKRKEPSTKHLDPKCPMCAGTGVIPSFNLDTARCPKCKGTGHE